jgi:hypothetical protein
MTFIMMTLGIMNITVTIRRTYFTVKLNVILTNAVMLSSVAAATALPPKIKFMANTLAYYTLVLG